MFVSYIKNNNLIKIFNTKKKKLFKDKLNAFFSFCLLFSTLVLTVKDLFHADCTKVFMHESNVYSSVLEIELICNTNCPN